VRESPGHALEPKKPALPARGHCHWRISTAAAGNSQGASVNQKRIKRATDEAIASLQQWIALASRALKGHDEKLIELEKRVAELEAKLQERAP
jgi:hypothetical protein